MVTPEFQSTLPVWGATSDIALDEICVSNFNPRSPCGERRSGCRSSMSSAIFQSTLPVWGATHAQQKTSQSQNISIHAPRVGSDVRRCWCCEVSCISIHAPRVGSDALKITPEIGWMNFNPRSPCGERLSDDCHQNCRLIISIHAPRVGSDAINSPLAVPTENFNPRSPCGERRR